jgi:hypothetical protein
LADLDEIAIRIAHVTTPFPAMIVERFGEEDRSFGAPLSVTVSDVGDAQVEKAVHPIEIGRSLKEDLGLIGSRFAAGIENDPGVGQLNVAGILRLNHFPAENSDVEVFRFFLIPHGEEMRKCVTKKPPCATGASGSFMRVLLWELEPKERIP